MRWYGGGNKRTFQKLIKKSDGVIVLYSACCHPSMELAKELCKKNDVPCAYHAGGASGAVEKGLSLIA